MKNFNFVFVLGLIFLLAILVIYGMVKKLQFLTS